MSGTFSQIYIQIVFAVKGRGNLIDRKDMVHFHIVIHILIVYVNIYLIKKNIIKRYYLGMNI